MQIRKILLPTDFSGPADRARSHALELARRFEAEITLLHVRTIYSDDPSRIAQELKIASQEALRARAEDIAKALRRKTKVNFELLRRISPVAGILEYLNTNPVDIVVIGTHGYSALLHLFLGSVTEKVVRHAPCPVLTVGHSAAASPPSAVAHKKILACFDFSKHSKEAARHAAEMAHVLGSELHVLYVLEQEVHPAFQDAWKTAAMRSLPSISASARQALEKEIRQEEIEAWELHVQTGTGKVHRDIDEFAREHGMDMIVMGTHGLSGFEHMLLGSTTERVVRIAHCPVLTFHIKKKQGPVLQ